MKIFVFGHIPTWAGGRQESGLANVIYQLAKHGSGINGVEVVLAATDCFLRRRKDGSLFILGWTKWMLIWSILMHPMRSLCNYRTLRKLVKLYPMREGMLGLFLKRVFFDKSIREVDPQIVHLHGVSSSWYMDLIPSGCKVAVTFHGLTGLDENIPMHDVLYKMEHDVFHSDKVDAVFFICTQLVYSFIDAYGENGKRNHVIFNSYDNIQFYYDDNRLFHFPFSRGEVNDGKTLCTVASMSDLKGQIRVLTSLASLPCRDKFKYFCIGSGETDYVRKLKEYAQKNGINFFYLGKMEPESIRKYFYEADYMIMPSSSEGFGLAYLEAIACGLPVILPKTIPIAQEKQIINENNSILLNDSSSESISKVLEQIDNYQFDRQAVAASVAGFSWDEIAQQYVDCFKEVIQLSDNE